LKQLAGIDALLALHFPKTAFHPRWVDGRKFAVGNLQRFDLRQDPVENRSRPVKRIRDGVGMALQEGEESSGGFDEVQRFFKDWIDEQTRQTRCFELLEEEVPPGVKVAHERRQGFDAGAKLVVENRIFRFAGVDHLFDFASDRFHLPDADAVVKRCGAKTQDGHGSRDSCFEWRASRTHREANCILTGQQFSPLEFEGENPKEQRRLASWLPSFNSAAALRSRERAKAFLSAQRLTSLFGRCILTFVLGHKVAKGESTMDDVLIAAYRGLVARFRASAEDIIEGPELRLLFLTEVRHALGDLPERQLLHRLTYLRKQRRLPRSRDIQVA
jgi:hypothetical protein